jgi:putative transposase
MPRSARRSIGGEVYHVLNRAAMRYQMFKSEKDYAAFEKLIHEAKAREESMRILSWCIMANHWHLVLWPSEDGQLSRFVSWLTMTHATRYRTSHRTVGYGPLYQGRFRSFVIERDDYLLTACRYVERNALRAGKVKKAEDWRWSSLWVAQNGTSEQKKILCEWPVDRPKNWLQLMNQPQTLAEEEALRVSIKRGRPFGGEKWQHRMALKLNLQSCFRKPGRPKKTS